MNLDSLDRQAGTCVPPYTRHEWGKEYGYRDLVMRSSEYQNCTHRGCIRRRIRVYTMRGNHVAGYDNNATTTEEKVR